MRYIIFILICISQIANSQISDFQIKGSTPKDTLFVLGTDTTAAGTKRGLGKWYNAYDLVNGLAVGGGGGTTNLSIAQSGGTQVIQSSSGTDVGVRNLYGLLITEGATDTLHFKVDSSLIATQYDITQIPISSLKAATATNTINNAAYLQEWQWNTLAGTSGLKLSSTSTAAASDLQRLLEVSLSSAANATSGETTVAGYFNNGRTGTNNTNYGVYSLQTGSPSSAFPGAAVYGLGDFIGVNGFSSTGGTSSVGVQGDVTSGTGMYATATSGQPFKGRITAGTSGVDPLVVLQKFQSGSASTLNGGSIDMGVETSGGSADTILSLIARWTDKTAATRTGEFIIKLPNSATTGSKLIVSGNGKLTLPDYGVGAFTGTAVADLFVTSTGEVIEGSMNGQSWTADADDADTELISNQTLKFEGGVGIVTDYTSGSPDKVAFVVDGDEFTTVTAAEATDYLLMHDENGAGADVLEKMLWSDFVIDLIGFEEDNTNEGNGSIIDVGTGIDGAYASQEYDISLDFNEFTTDAAFEGDEYVIVSDGVGVQEKVLITDITGGSDTNFAEDDLTFTGNRVHDLGANTLTLSGSVANVTFKDNNGGTGDNVIIVSELGAGTGVTGGISFETQNGGTPTDQFDIEANKLATNESTLTIKSEQGTDAHTVFEKNAGLADNTTESHMSMNAGRAYTQNYEWTATGADLTLDRSYNIVNVTGAGAIGDEINLPEAASTSDNFDTGLTDAQVQVGQEYTITALRNASTGLVLRPFTGDLINGAASITLPYSANGTSVVVKLVRWSGGVGQWFTY